MAANPDVEIDINYLINFAVEQELIPLDQAEACARDLVAAYVKGAAYRDEDDTPYAGVTPYGFHRAHLPPIDVLENYFICVRYTVEEDPAWENNPLLAFFENLELAIFSEVDEQEDAVRQLEALPSASSMN